MHQARESDQGKRGQGFVSRSPYGDRYAFDPVSASQPAEIDGFLERNPGREVVVVQGLGFVGSAMTTAIASARTESGEPKYAVIGVDVATPESYWKVGRINAGLLPVVSLDEDMDRVFRENFRRGHILATTDPHAYAVADVIVVDINLDAQKKGFGRARERSVDLTAFKAAMRTMADRMKPSCLVVVESTVPPGTCEKIVLPIMREAFKKRGLPEAPIRLAHSYERVMPGRNYLKSITQFYRVYSGVNEEAKRQVRSFLESFIDTKNFPLSEVSTTNGSEIGKVLENSFRAANIALIQEWTEFAEHAGVNLFEVIRAIRMRETHKNIMLPGFGVGGYCLTKDPLLADWASVELFGGGRLDMSLQAVDINDLMPLHSFRLLERALGSLAGKTVLLMGVSYLNNVADTRNSPSEMFYRRCAESGASVVVHDPLVCHWPEVGIPIATGFAELRGCGADAVVMAVRHDEYMGLKPEAFSEFLKDGGWVLDVNDVVDDKKADGLRRRGFHVVGVGKGHWNICERA